MMVLINILMHWWQPEEWPYPRPTLIAQRMRITVRSVERHIQRLVELGIMEWLPRDTSSTGPAARRFNLRGLVERLEQLAGGATEHSANAA
jgi:DNA-binding MarR family transcriptional regulator